MFPYKKQWRNFSNKEMNNIIESISYNKLGNIDKIISNVIYKRLGSDWQWLHSDLKQTVLISIYEMDPQIITDNIDRGSIDALLRKIATWHLNPGKNGTKDGMSSFWKENVYPIKINNELNGNEVSYEETTSIYNYDKIIYHISSLPWYESIIAKYYFGLNDSYKLNGNPLSMTEISKKTGVKYYMVRYYIDKIKSKLKNV